MRGSQAAMGFTAHAALCHMQSHQRRKRTPVIALAERARVMVVRVLR